MGEESRLKEHGVATQQRIIAASVPSLGYSARRRQPIGWRVCSECDTEKLLSKYYRHPHGPGGFMSHCKACHNGCTETNRRLSAELIERQLGDPSEEQIAMMTSKIRSMWTEKVRLRRRGQASVAPLFSQ